MEHLLKKINLPLGIVTINTMTTTLGFIIRNNVKNYSIQIQLKTDKVFFYGGNIVITKQEVYFLVGGRRIIIYV